jgi:DNA-binding MarR family transcriptional regulator
MDVKLDIPTGTQTLILSKLYYGILTKSLDKLEIDRYFAVLLFLSHNKNCCQQVVCDSLKIDKAAMVKVLDYLSKADYIQRKTNPKDRREHFIVLSKKGEKQTKEIQKAVQLIEQKAFEHVVKQDEVVFKRVLDRITENLKEMPSNKDLFFNYKSTKKTKKI